MSNIPPVNFRSFNERVRRRKKAYKKFLGGLEKQPVRGLDGLTDEMEKGVWQEVDCLSCANCCKKMTPTYTMKDMTRIANHLQMTVNEFKKKWLIQEKKSGDWINKSLPCQFLNLADNKCSIYEVRPVDCSGFPHLPKKRIVDYIHIHQQNLEFCPATFRMVEKLMEKVGSR